MKKFFRKIMSFLAGLFTNLNEWIYDHVQPSIEMVERIKSVVDSPVGDLVVALIPGNIDDKLRDALIAQLTKAIDAMHITHDIVSEPDWTSKVARTIAYLRMQSKPVQAALYKKLASELSKQSGFSKAIEEAIKQGLQEDVVDLKVKGHSIDLLVQMQYSKMKEGIEAKDLADVDPYAKPAEKAVAAGRTFFGK